MTRRFTDEQLAVANHIQGHALVSAVAGSGKTTTLVERCRRLLQHGVPESKILCLQYNKDAQLDFERRLRRRLGDGTIPQVRTFHSYCLEMLKRLEAGGHVIRTAHKDSGAEDGLMRRALKDCQPKGTFLSQAHFEMLSSLKTLTKSGFDSPEEVYDRTEMPFEDRAFIVAAYRRFEQFRQQYRWRFFDDQIYDTACALQNDPGLWDLFRGRFDQIQVDEFQDISEVQMSIVEGLAGPNTTVVAVGDLNQSIYSFRGSAPRFIRSEFEARFAPCTRFPLNTTFRYGDELALVANHLIGNNKDRDDTLTIAADGNPDTIVELAKPVKGRNPTIIDHLKLRQASGTLSDVAMLVRNFSHGMPLQLEMLGERIPFFVYGREGMLYNPEIGCLISAMAMAADHWPFPERSIEKFILAMLSAPSVFTTTAMTRMLAASAMDIMESQGSRSLGTGLKQALAEAKANMSPEDLKRWNAGPLTDRISFMEMLCTGSMAGMRPGQVIDTYVQYTNLFDALPRQSRTKEDGEEKIRNVQALRAAAEGFDTLVAFLDELGPLAAHEKDKPPPYDHVRIQSVHTAKGAEFPMVILPSWSAGSFPSTKPSDAEEERRLAYVAITRAKHHLMIQHAEDPLLDAWNDTIEDFPPEQAVRRASPYLFEAELGICRRVAAAIREGQRDTITTRNATVSSRYLEAKGMAGLITLETPAHLSAINQGRPLTDIASLTPGVLVWNKRRGTCEILSRVGTSPAFHIRLEDGTTAYEVFEHGGSWLVL